MAPFGWTLAPWHRIFLASRNLWEVVGERGIDGKAADIAGRSVRQNCGMAPEDPLDFLPSAEAVADDLDNVVVRLDRYKSLTLPSLRALPSVRGWRTSDPRASERERSNLAIVATVYGAIDRLEDSRRTALEELFTFEDLGADLGDRQEAAGRHLGIGADAMRKSRQRILMRELAEEIYRGELAWCLDQLTAMIHNPSGTWYRILEIERTLVIDPRRPERQEWTARYVLRSCAPAHPIVVIPQGWSGSGSEEPGDLTVLSGQAPMHRAIDPEDDIFTHRFLRARPIQHGIATYHAYIFDLGLPVPPGQEVELAYHQVLTDDRQTFKPVIGASCIGHPEMRRISMRVSAPNVKSAHAYKIAPTSAVPPWDCAGALPASYAASGRSAGSEDVPRGADGFLTYERTSDLTGYRFEMWWGPFEGSGWAAVDSLS